MLLARRIQFLLKSWFAFTNQLTMIMLMTSGQLLYHKSYKVPSFRRLKLVNLRVPSFQVPSLNLNGLARLMNYGVIIGSS